MSKVQSSISLANWDVNDMGLKSSSILVGGETLGTGTTMDLFKAFGKNPCIIDEFYMSAIIGASSQAKIFRVLCGSISVPGNFVVLISRNFF